MSKELIERLRHDRYDWLRSQAADRIEELERERDALLADNERLRDLIPKRVPNGFVSFGKYYAEQEDKFNDPYNLMCKFKRKYLSDCEEALATAPAQSLARIRNQVRDECAALSERRGDIGTATVIRTTKEPE